MTFQNLNNEKVCHHLLILMSFQLYWLNWILKTQRQYLKNVQLFCPNNENKVFSKTTLKPTDFHWMDKKTIYFCFISRHKRSHKFEITWGILLCIVVWAKQMTIATNQAFNSGFKFTLQAKLHLQSHSTLWALTAALHRQAHMLITSTIWMSSKVSWETTMSLMWCLPIAGALIHSSLAKQGRFFPKHNVHLGQ